jgi:hypothetical protein
MSHSKDAILRSNGETMARAYIELVVPSCRPEPPTLLERVVLVDPRHTVTLSGPPKGAGARNPDQRVFPTPKAPGIEMPDARPLMKAQRFWIDPELLEQWDREEAQKRAGSA